MIRILTILLLAMPLFGSTLEGLIDYAMTHSTAVKQGQAQTQLAQASQKESRSAHFGNIDLVGSYTHFNLPRTLVPLTPAAISTDPNVATTKNLFSTGVMYTIPLFTGFSQTRQVEMDAIAAKLSQSRLSLTKEQLAFNVASLYLSILALQDMSQAQKQHVQALKKLKNTIQNEVEFGKKAHIDLLKAQSDLYENISYLEVIKGNITITKASLASLVGMEAIRSVQPMKVSVRKPNHSLGKLLTKASSLNKVAIADLNIKKADKGIKKSESGKLPQVSLSSYYGYNYGENDPGNHNSGAFEKEKNWQIGLTAKWTLYDFGKRDAATQKAKIAHMQAAFDKQQTLLDLKKSLIEASEKMKQEYANYQSNTRQLALAAKSEKIEQVRYHNGVSTINDLLYAKSQTHVASAKLIESKYNYQKGKFYMDYLLERGYKPTSSDIKKNSIKKGVIQ